MNQPYDVGGVGGVTPHFPTPHTPHLTSLMIAKKLHQEGNNFQ
ncbi:hypothetical protein [Microcystis sp.]